MKWLLGLVTLAYSAGLCHAQSAPSIESTAGGSILITIPSDKAVQVQYTDPETGRAEGAPVALATQTDLDALRDRVYELEATRITKEKADSDYISNAGATALAKATDVAVLNGQLTEALKAIATLSAWQKKNENAAVVTCGELESPQDGSVRVPAEHIPGALARYECDDFYFLSGSDVSTCLSTGEWSGAAPTCKHVNEGSEQNPGQSCKAIYWARSQQQEASAIKDGAYWIKPTDSARPFQVWCDMTTKTKDGHSGWTMCGKLDRERRGSKYLSQGFGRAPSGSKAMASLFNFDDAVEGQKWTSIDCRNILQSTGGYGDGFGKGSGWAADAGIDAGVTPGGSWFMHAASNGVGNGAGYVVAQFTNVLDDVRKDATKLFDTASEDTGVCVTNDVGTSETGGITTYDLDWGVYTDHWNTDSGGRMLHKDVGGCLSGDGHHFCSFDRLGMQLNNANGYEVDPDILPEANKTAADGCRSSIRDTVFWAWNENNHGCGGPSRTRPDQDLPIIGTGCQRYNANTPSKLAKVKGLKNPPNRYNFLFVW